MLADLPNEGSTKPLTIPQQKIRFCRSSDGVQIAYSSVGQGPPLVRTGNWMTHLEKDLESPIWRHLWRDLARDHTLVRYDARGMGLSDRPGNVDAEHWVEDSLAVLDAVGSERAVILGISAGVPTAILFAALAYALCVALGLPSIVGLIAAVLVLLAGIPSGGYG